MITQENVLWSFNKFSQLVLWEMYGGQSGQFACGYLGLKARLCSKGNWREPSALHLSNLGCSAYDLHEKSKIF